MAIGQVRRRTRSPDGNRDALRTDGGPHAAAPLRNWAQEVALAVADCAAGPGGAPTADDVRGYLDTEVGLDPSIQHVRDVLRTLTDAGLLERRQAASGDRPGPGPHRYRLTPEGRDRLATRVERRLQQLDREWVSVEPQLEDSGDRLVDAAFCDDCDAVVDLGQDLCEDCREGAPEAPEGQA